MMRVVGYVKEIIENSFSIPIYAEKGKLYCHSLDDDFKIKSFYETTVLQDHFVDYNLYKDFEINDIAPLVFIGFNNIVFFESADLVIDRIGNYINETTKSDKYLLIKEEISELKNKLFKDERQILVESESQLQAKVIRQQGSAVRNILKMARGASGHVDIDLPIYISKFSGAHIGQFPYAVVANFESEYNIKHDVSKISTKDVQDYFKLHQQDDFNLIINSAKYTLIHLILTEYLEFYNIRNFSLTYRRRFIQFINNEIARNVQSIKGGLFTGQGSVFIGKEVTHSSKPNINPTRNLKRDRK